MSAAPSSTRALHALEAEAMDVVWDTEEASVRAVMEVLNEQAPKPRAYTPLESGRPAPRHAGL